MPWPCDTIFPASRHGWSGGGSAGITPTSATDCDIPPITAARAGSHPVDTEGGCVMRSRFWIGDIAPRGALGPLRGLIDRPVVRRRLFSLEDCRDLLIHCAQEMSHFSVFLPKLYAAHGAMRR